MAYRVGVDIGGTFTDFALFDPGGRRFVVHKQLTTPEDPSLAVVDGVARLLAKGGVAVADVDTLAHGTTLVTNALIERKGARTGMLVTRGFLSVLDIGTEHRYDLFDLRLRFPEPVAPRRLRREVDERVHYTGRVRRPVDVAAAVAAARELVEEERIEALALCFLHSYAEPAHEAQVAAAVRQAFPGLYVSSSSEVFPFMREYERWTTTAVNAYTQPLVDRYVAHLEQGLERLGFRGTLSIMASNGGSMTPDAARRFPVRMLESGPAAGVLMSAVHGRALGLEHLLSFDMGGTTAKGSLIEHAEPLRRYRLEVARVHEFKRGSGLPLGIPAIDMIEIGAGGGSIAQVDERGVIQVGPESAGARPGPVCYGRGGERPTLTDANLALGYLDAGFFLGGEMPLDREAAERAIARHVAAPLDLPVDRAAWGIHEVINEAVARAFRVHASERGFDYRRCAMVAFGGSGPVNAFRIARKLKIPRVVLPVGAGVMSAFGLLASPRSFEIVRSDRVFLDRLSPEGLAERFRPLVEETSAYLRAAGEKAGDIRIVRRLDMRYTGQGYEVEVALPELDEAALLERLPRLFEEAYEKVFAMSFLEERMEVVNWKVEARGPLPELGDGFVLDAVSPGASARKGTRRAWFPEAGAYADTPVYDRYALKPGDSVAGPALIEENESTCVLGHGDRVTVDARLNLVGEIAVEGEAA